MNKRVVILQEFLPQYRVPFFEALRTELASQSIELILIHGQAPPRMAARNDSGHLDWATRIRNRRTAFIGVRLVWQPALLAAFNADAVIVEQANRLLINYVLLAGRLLGSRTKVAFWGHGSNRQTLKPDALRERLKRRLSTRPDWWFAYTQGTANRIASVGYPIQRITAVQNAIQVAEQRAFTATRERMHCVFVGGLSSTKRLDFLLDAAVHLGTKLQGFHLTVIGDGPLRGKVEDAATRLPWLSYAGPVFGDEKAALMGTAQLMLMPGLVGLAVVDSFAAGTPTITTAISFHSPEIEYIEHGENGLVLPAETTPLEYADAVETLLLDEAQLERLRIGCAASREIFTLEQMVNNFAGGIASFLSVKASGE